MRVKGVNRFRHSRTGVWYTYHRASKQRIYADFGSPLFFEELARIEKGHRAESAKEGTLGLLVQAYTQSPRWPELAAKTREGYQRVFDVLYKLRDEPTINFTRATILRFRDTQVFPKHGRWLANYTVTVLGILFGYGTDLGLMRANPLAEKVKHIRRPRGTAQPNRPWSREECRIVLDRAPIQLAIPLALAMFAGLRKGDFLTITLSQIIGGVIAIRTKKRDMPVQVPVHPELAAILDKRPDWPAVQVAATMYGTPWTPMGFMASWGKLRRSLEAEGVIAPGLTPHGLRHTLGTRLREAGADDRTIADVLGQASTAMARHYSKQAELPERARGLVVNLDQTAKRK